MRERDLLSEKYQLVSTGGLSQVDRTGAGQGHGEGEGVSSPVRWGESIREDGKPIEQAYDELEEEYKVCFPVLF